MKYYAIDEIKNKKILGRSAGIVEVAGEKVLPLLWAASAVEVKVKSAEVWLKVSGNYDTHEPWLVVQINGRTVSRIMIPKGETLSLCIARNLNPEKENLITILKDTQPMPGDNHHSLLIKEIGLADNGEFLPVPERKLKVEFVGDSITSGEGCAGAVNEWDWITTWMSVSANYAFKTVKNLDADWSIVSQCGWGICWGWDGNRHSSLPMHYENVCSVLSGDYQDSLGVTKKYDFGKGSDFVVVNLGTNDNGAFFQSPWKDENGNEYVLSKDKIDRACEKDGLQITEAVKAFLSVIRKNNPSAKILWVWGMIKLSTVTDYIKLGIAEYKEKTGDDCVYSMELPAMEDVELTEDDKGSRGHPGPKTHLLAAEKITAFIKSMC